MVSRTKKTAASEQQKQNEQQEIAPGKVPSSETEADEIAASRGEITPFHSMPQQPTKK